MSYPRKFFPHDNELTQSKNSQIELVRNNDWAPKVPEKEKRSTELSLTQFPRDITRDGGFIENTSARALDYVSADESADSIKNLVEKKNLLPEFENSYERFLLSWNQNTLSLVANAINQAVGNGSPILFGTKLIRLYELKKSKSTGKVYLDIFIHNFQDLYHEWQVPGSITLRFEFTDKLRLAHVEFSNALLEEMFFGERNVKITSEKIKKAYETELQVFDKLKSSVEGPALQKIAAELYEEFKKVSPETLNKSDLPLFNSLLTNTRLLLQSPERLILLQNAKQEDLIHFIATLNENPKAFPSALSEKLTALKNKLLTDHFNNLFLSIDQKISAFEKQPDVENSLSSILSIVSDRSIDQLTRFNTLTQIDAVLVDPTLWPYLNVSNLNEAPSLKDAVLTFKDALAKDTFAKELESLEKLKIDPSLDESCKALIAAIKQINFDLDSKAEAYGLLRKTSILLLDPNYNSDLYIVNHPLLQTKLSSAIDAIKKAAIDYHHHKVRESLMRTPSFKRVLPSVNHHQGKSKKYLTRSMKSLTDLLGDAKDKTGSFVNLKDQLSGMITNEAALDKDKTALTLSLTSYIALQTRVLAALAVKPNDKLTPLITFIELIKEVNQESTTTILTLSEILSYLDEFQTQKGELSNEDVNALYDKFYPEALTYLSASLNFDDTLKREFLNALYTIKTNRETLGLNYYDLVSFIMASAKLIKDNLYTEFDSLVLTFKQKFAHSLREEKNLQTKKENFTRINNFLNAVDALYEKFYPEAISSLTTQLNFNPNLQKEFLDALNAIKTNRETLGLNYNDLVSFVMASTQFIKDNSHTEFDNFVLTFKQKIARSLREEKNPQTKKDNVARINNLIDSINQLNYQCALSHLDKSLKDPTNNNNPMKESANLVLQAIDARVKTLDAGAKQADLPEFTNALRQTQVFVDKKGLVTPAQFDAYANLGEKIGKHSENKRILGGMLCVLGVTVLALSIALAFMTAFAATPASVLGAALGGSMLAAGLTISGIALTGVGLTTAGGIALFKENKARPVEKEMQQVLDKSSKIPRR